MQPSLPLCNWLTFFFVGLLFCFSLFSFCQIFFVILNNQVQQVLEDGGEGNSLHVLKVMCFSSCNCANLNSKIMNRV